MNSINDVYEIFKDYFGEDKVDLGENDNILIYFPRITVTNEYNKSVDITEVYVNVPVSQNGTLKGIFTINRAEYTYDQFISGYCHSHVPSLNYNNLDLFNSPCLGTGPLNRTISSLIAEYDEDIWRLFCTELSLYLTKESVEGGPYIRLESIGCLTNSRGRWIIYPIKYNRIITNNGVSHTRVEALIKRFYPYIIKSKKIPFCYINGNYSIALSNYEILLTLSNLYIEWYNSLPNDQKPEEVERIFRENICEEVKCSEGRIYRKISYYNMTGSAKDYIGKLIVKFKGKPVYLNITNIQVDTDNNLATVIAKPFAERIVDKLLKEVNYELGGNRKISNSKNQYTTYINKNIKLF